MPAILRPLLAFSVLLITSLGGCILSAQDARPVLRAVYGDFYPYAFTGPDGAAQGYSIDVMTHLGTHAGYQIEFIEALNPKEFLAMLARGEVDMTTFLALTPERRAAGLETASLGEFVVSVYVRRDSAIEDIGALAQGRIGVVVGAITQAAASLLPSVELVNYEVSDDLLLPLLSGEVDAVVAVAEMFDERLRANFITDKVRRIAQPLAITPYGIIVRPDLPDAHAAVSRAIVQTVTPEVLRQKRARWFGQDPSILQHPWFDNVAIILGGIALTTVSLGLYSYRLRRRSARLTAEHGANQLLIDALDQLRAAITIFDEDMLAVHWNDGFARQFPHLVPALQDSTTLAQTLKIFWDQPDTVAAAPDRFEAVLQKLKSGQSDQGIVHTCDGNSFELSVLPLGPRYFAAIWMDVTQLHQQQQQLAEQTVLLESKNDQLTIFSAMAAHDLKAPLVQQSVLLQFVAEDLREANLSLPPSVQGHLTLLEDLSRRMDLLVGDLLKYARADAAQKSGESFSPNARLDDVLTLSGVQGQMDVQIMPDMPLVHVDPTCFDMVMRNLISNAKKHHDKAWGTILISARTTATGVMIEVADDGPGIAAEDSERVFEPFARLTRVEGTGLGLALVKRTVAGWDGTISLHAAKERGCAFRVTLPAGRLETAQKNRTGGLRAAS